jgi:putative peptide zinc metalloprotease protein
MTADQAIPWTTRIDLQAVEIDCRKAFRFSVKDPVKNEYYYFSQVEYFLLTKLRTRQTFSSLIEFSAKEHGRRIGVRDIQKYLKQLARDNLIVPNVFGDAERLFGQQKSERRALWQQQLVGLLSIRMGGFYPGAFLKLLAPLGWLCFSPISLTLFGIAVLVTLVFAGLSVESLGPLVPSLAELTTPRMLAAVLIAFCLSKILHELGHALACQYAGRECSEMGLLLLVGLPCVYCDVSDMWTERRLGKRLLVTLAGVWVELGIALICFWVWYTTVPGGLHTFCYSLMLITSVNTFLLNGNPLMRYDGYYAMSDLVGIPNLGTVAKQHFRERLSRFFWIRESVIDRTPMRGLLLYEVCAKAYRLFILCAIGAGVWKYFDYHQLTSLGTFLAGMILAAACVPMLLTSIQTLRTIPKRVAGDWREFRWFNALLAAATVLSVAFLVWGVEFSHRVWGTVELQLADAEQVFAPSDGKFIPNVRDGQRVMANHLIATIDNPELELEQLTLSTQLAETQLNLKLIRLKSDAVSLAGDTEFWTLREATLSLQLKENETKRDALKILAAKAGQFVGFDYPSEVVDPPVLVQKQGSLFDPENGSIQVNRGDPIGYVGNPERMRGILRVDQKDIELIEIGQEVRIAIPFESNSHSAKVVEIALEQDESNGQPSNQTSSSMPQQVTYQVLVDLEAISNLRVGSSHAAVVLCHKTNVFSFVGRWLRNSFWF